MAEVKVKGVIVAESTSPVGKGTAGLLFMNGIPPPPLSGITVAILSGGGDADADACFGLNGHGYPGAGADPTGGSAGGETVATLMASF